MSAKKVRDPGLDIIRSIALICVICVHFFLNTDFYETTVAGTRMLIMSVMRNSFMICVPLFMMLTGYLINSREVNKGYYLKIIRILYTYVMVSLVCGLFRRNVLDSYSISETILGIFSFEAAPYSWYIEMYIGFFLLIPFLNIMYDGVDTQRKKQILVITLLLLTALPGVLNIYNVKRIADSQWWMMPSVELSYSKVVPSWWTNIYPITYFFLGKYLREYSIRWKPKQIAVVGAAVYLTAGIYNYYRSYGRAFIWGSWQEYGSLIITAQTVLLFAFFIRIEYSNLPAVFRRVFSKISDLSLGAYLSSWIFDTIIYTRLNEAIPTVQQKLIWFPVVITLVLIGSLTCAYVIDLFYSLFVKGIIQRYTRQATGI